MVIPSYFIGINSPTVALISAGVKSASSVVRAYLGVNQFFLPAALALLGGIAGR